MTAAADIAEARADAWRAAQPHRPARLALQGRAAVDAMVVGDEDLALAGEGGRWASRLTRRVTVSVIAADVGNASLAGRSATVTDGVTGQATAGEITGDILRSGPVWTLTIEG